MSLLDTFLLTQFANFVLVLARVGGLMMTAPIFGSRAAPIHFRIFLAVAMSLLITPLFSSALPVAATDLTTLARYAASETLVGLLIGVGVTILLNGVQLTGQLITQLGGTAVAESFSEQLEDNAPVYSQMFYFLTLAMFVLLDGHRLSAEALLDTYAWLPPGKAVAGESFVTVLTMLMGQSFQLGVRAAAPAMTALLLSTLVLGLLGRTLPQLNVLAVGFSLNALLTLAITFFSIGAIAWAFPQQTVGALDALRDAVREAANLGKLALPKP